MPRNIFEKIYKKALINTLKRAIMHITHSSLPCSDLLIVAGKCLNDDNKDLQFYNIDDRSHEENTIGQCRT